MGFSGFFELEILVKILPKYNQTYETMVFNGTYGTYGTFKKLLFRVFKREIRSGMK